MEEVDSGGYVQDQGFGFCGIANPDAFRSTLERSGFTLAGFVPLGDHQRYSADVIEKLSARARRAGARFLVTTEKDLVKLGAYAADLSLPLLALRLEVVVDEVLVRQILARIQA